MGYLPNTDTKTVVTTDTNGLITKIEKVDKDIKVIHEYVVKK
jgi:hypothetical protein